MMYLSLREVLLIHSAVINIYGGEDGIRDQKLVESAIARPRASFEGYEAYSDIFTKAAVLLEGLTKNHGFVDGNKRTALAVTAMFLKRNGYKLKAPQRVVVKQVILVATDLSSVKETTEWLKKHTEKC